MTKAQKQLLNSFGVTESVLAAFILVWNTPGPFVNAVNKFFAFLTNIRLFQQIQSVNIKGIRQNKQNKQEFMALLSFKISNALQMYASDMGNDELYQSANITMAMLLRDSGSAAVADADTIKVLATENRNALAAYGVTDDNIELFAVSIAEFQNSISAPKRAINNKKRATRELKKLCKDCRKLINTTIKKGTANFKEPNPDFFDAMMDSFKINDLPVRHTEMDFTILDSMSKDAIYGVEVIARQVTDPSHVMTQYSNMQGDADFVEISPEIRDIEFVIPSHSPVTKRLELARGKKVELTVELNKI